MTEPPNYYDILGVSPDATDAEIRRAYRQRAFLLHPDRHAGAPPDVQAEASRAMAAVNEAWKVLSDPDLRRAYDAFLAMRTGSRDTAGAAAASGMDTTASGVRDSADACCLVCGGVPARRVRFIALTGLILWVRIRTLSGHFCQSCGTAIGRHLTNSTLAGGWFALSAVVNPLVVLFDLWQLRRLKKLPPPAYPFGVSWLGPLDPGRPLRRRGGVCVAALFVVIGLAIAATQLADRPSDTTDSPPTPISPGDQLADDVSTLADCLVFAHRDLAVGLAETGTSESAQCLATFWTSVSQIDIPSAAADDRTALLRDIETLTGWDLLSVETYCRIDREIQQLAADLQRPGVRRIVDPTKC